MRVFVYFARGFSCPARFGTRARRATGNGGRVYRVWAGVRRIGVASCVWYIVYGPASGVLTWRVVYVCTLYVTLCVRYETLCDVMCASVVCGRASAKQRHLCGCRLSLSPSRHGGPASRTKSTLIPTQDLDALAGGDLPILARPSHRALRHDSLARAPPPATATTGAHVLTPSPPRRCRI